MKISSNFCKNYLISGKKNIGWLFFVFGLYFVSVLAIICICCFRFLFVLTLFVGLWLAFNVY